MVYETETAIQVETVGRVKDVGLVCPHCRKRVHAFYTSEDLEQKAKRLGELFSRYRRTLSSKHLDDARTAQESYRREFVEFNTKVERKRKETKDGAH